jgi:hypothetical protein
LIAAPASADCAFVSRLQKPVHSILQPSKSCKGFHCCDMF